MLVAGVDVGGTNIEVGLVDDDDVVVDRRKSNTPKGGPAAVVDVIVDLVSDFGEDVGAVGVGIPGAVHDGVIVRVPNLENWDGDVELRDLLTDRLQVPVALGNDANIGLLGEWVAGAARGKHDVLGVWIGTGIGGALVLDGRPYQGALGAAGEIGHMVIRADGALCHCGRRGCLEAYAGRRAMADAVRRITEGDRSTTLFAIQDDEDKSKPTSKVWKRALDEGDEVATEVFALAVETLGIGIGSMVNLLEPEMVVIGGGMADQLGQDFADRLHAAAAPWMLHADPDLEVVVAELGDDSGVVGAATLARALLLAP